MVEEKSISDIWDSMNFQNIIKDYKVSLTAYYLPTTKEPTIFFFENDEKKQLFKERILKNGWVVE